ncbi:hypothetical protein D3C76_1046940 [compost metagenome]
MQECLRNTKSLTHSQGVGLYSFTHSALKTNKLHHFRNPFLGNPFAHSLILLQVVVPRHVGIKLRILYNTSHM